MDKKSMISNPFFLEKNGLPESKENSVKIFKFVVIWMVLLITVLGTGCMNTDANLEKSTDSSGKCSVIVPSGDSFSLNETFNGKTVCTSQSGDLLLELPDSSRTGREWVVTSTPGLVLADEGTIWYDENGVPTTVPGLGRGVRTWKIQILETGTQKIHAELQFPAGGKQSPDKVLEITIVIT